MSTKAKSRMQRQRLTSANYDRNSGQKRKSKLVVSKTFLSLPVRKRPEVSVTCLSRKTNTKNSLKFSSANVNEKTQSETLYSAQHKLPQSTKTQDAGPYFFHDEENDEGPLKNKEAGRKRKGTRCEVKQSVLSTISRMLQENRIIRERWISCLRFRQVESKSESIKKWNVGNAR